MLGHYLQLALRGFRRNKLSTLVNLVSLSLGLAGFVAAYAVSNDFLSVGERYPLAERTYVLTQSVTQGGAGVAISDLPLTGAAVARYLHTDLPKLAVVARSGYAPVEHAVATGDVKTYASVLFADPEYLDVFPEAVAGLGVENPLRQPRTALVGPAAAVRLFGEPTPIGRTLRMANAVDVTIGGVFETDPTNQMGTAYDLLVSLDTRLALERAARGVDSEAAGQPDSWAPELVTYVVLPADGSITPAQLQRELDSFDERHLPPQMVESGTTMTFGAIHISRLVVAFVGMLAGGGLGVDITTVIMIVGCLILAMSCLNYANLAAAQTFIRSRQVGLSKVLGAKSRDVFFQSLVEAVTMVAAALVLALTAAEIAMPVVNAASSFTLDMPYSSSPILWGTLLAIVAGVGVLAGGYPAFLLARIRPVQMLAGGASRSGSHVLRRLLVGGQFTVATILLILVGVMFAHNREMRALGGNLATDPIVVIDSSLPADETTRDALVAALTADPAVRSVTATALAPWALDQMSSVALSRTGDAGGQGTPYLLNLVDYDFFATLDTPLLAGRVFDRSRGSDRVFWGATAEENATPQRAVVDRTFTERFGWPSPADAVGKTVYRRYGNGSSRPVEIIGIVEDVPYRLVSYGMGSASIYLLNPNETRMLLVRVARESLPAALAHIDRTWNAFSPSIPIKRRFMDELFDQNYEVFEIFNEVFAGLAAFAVLVACIGLFGSATYATGRRVREIGVRKTLGASSNRIVRMLLWDFSKPVLVANAIAWPVGFVVMQVYFSLFVFRAETTAAPFVASLALTLTVAWLAVAAQSYDASRVQPARVLRSE